MELTLLVVTLVSLGLAAAMSVVGWRLLTGDRARSAARVEALEAEAMSIDVAIPEPLFADTVASDGHRRGRVGITTAALVVTAAGAIVFAMHGSRGAQWPAPRVPPPAPAAAIQTPLELISIQHGTMGQSFTVTGRVQNPSAARPVTGVVAVIYLFDRNERYVGSGRGRLTSLSLEPGENSSFAIQVATDAEVGRYRVVFERTDGSLMPHVDRRASAPATAAAGDGGRTGSADAAGGSDQ